MTLDGFLAALSLIVAIFAVVSPISRLKLLLRIRVQIVFATAAFAAVMYFEFFDLVGQRCLLQLGKFCHFLVFPDDKSFTPQNAAFFVVIAWLIAAYTVFSFPRVNPRSLPAFRRLLDWLIYEKRYSELVDLTEPNLRMLERASTRQLPTQLLYDSMKPKEGGRFSSPIGILNDAGAESSQESAWVRMIPDAWLDAMMRIYAPLIGVAKMEESAKEIIDMILSSRDFGKYLASTRPYAAIPLLGLSRYAVYEFSNNHLQLLLQDSGSVLYQEVSRPHALSDEVGLALNDEDLILNFYLSDVGVMRKFSVWKPVGDFVLRYLRTDRVTEYSSLLKHRSDYFDADSSHDPVLVGIQFFDLLVTRAAYQGARWHMWLYYVPLIVKKLEEHYDTSRSEVDESDEFPILAAHLIYECFDVLRHWVWLFRDLPEGSVVREVRLVHGRSDGRIPTAAAEALGEALHTVVTSERIDGRFSAHMLEVVIRCVTGLSPDNEEQELRSFLVSAVVRGGRRNEGGEYRRQLRVLLANLEGVYSEDFGDLSEAILVE